MTTHTAIVTSAKGKLEAIQLETPIHTWRRPGPHQGYGVEYPMVLGFNAAGTVAKIGSGVNHLVVGDRVTSFTYQSSLLKGMQEYTCQPATTCAKVPASVSLDGAATIPDNFITAFGTLFNPTYLALPRPSTFPATEVPSKADEPIVIYGAGSTAGQYAIQLLHSAGYKNVIATASKRHHAYLHELGATHTFDYNSSSLTEDITKAVNGKVELVMDCISTESTLKALAPIVSSTAKVAVLLPVKEGDSISTEASQMYIVDIPARLIPFPETVQFLGVRTFLYQTHEWQKENLMPKLLPQLLESGIIKPNRVRLLAEGSFKERVEKGLNLFRNHEVSGEKVVVKVPST
ncbi:hypothetical protein C8J56DRAFT_1012018 [Mycena floridula]|nr:hypothetical protein C8J56DRAFT_1012018 [Mycena floridula]